MLKSQRKHSNYCKSIISGATNTFDLFGMPPQFQILKQSQFSSALGLVFTLAIVAVCLLYFGISLQDIIYNTSPSVTFSEIQSIESLEYPLLMSNFTMGILLTNLNLVSLSTIDKYFTISIQNCHRSRRVDETTGKTNTNLTCVPYNIESCSMDKHFPNKFQKDYFQAYNLSNIFCLNYDQWLANPPSLQGTPSADDYRFLTVLVSSCRNTTTKTDCASQDLINAQLATGYYAVHLSDALVKSELPGFPFEETISMQYTTFSITTSKQVQQLLKNIEFNTDVGLVFETEIKQNQYIQSINKETQDAYNGKYLIYETFALDIRSSVYFRSYEKFQTLLGNVGGLWQVLYLASSVILSPVVLMMMNLQLINRVFDFDKQDHTKSNVQEEIKNSMKTTNVAQKRRSYVAQKTVFNTKVVNIKDDKQISEYLREKKNSLYYAFREVLLIILGCKRKEYQQINYATEKIMQKLDVLHIVQKLVEVDKLKSILLTKEQQNLFNYLPRPTIPRSLFENNDVQQIKLLEKIPQYKFILEEERSQANKLQDAFEAYKQIRDSEQSQIDERLLETLDGDILSLFQSLGPDKVNVSQHPQILCTFHQDSSVMSPMSGNLEEQQDILVQAVPYLPGVS